MELMTTSVMRGSMRNDTAVPGKCSVLSTVGVYGFPLHMLEILSY